MENQNNTEEHVAPVKSGATSQQKKWVIIGVVILAALYILKSFIFSPENINERMIESATDGEYDVSIDKDGGYTTTSKDGESVNVTSGGTAKVPDNWPSTVPIPSGVKVEYAAVMAGQDSANVSTLNYTTDKSAESISDLYKTELAQNGWTIQAQVATGDGFMLTAMRSEEEAVSVYITSAEGKTNVMLSVQEKK
jgi:hypothetical protein